MKLRNKKTGEITDLAKRGLIKSDNDNHIIVYPEGTLKYYAYDSLAELNEEWEDYKPAEPLIKDEKIRKAVRAWAEANEIVKAFVVMNERINWTVYGDDVDRNRFSIEFFDRVVSGNDETRNYTIAELCGEEGECVEVEITTREYDHAEAISRATENLCGEEEE